jgi:hypothetical protein
MVYQGDIQAGALLSQFGQGGIQAAPTALFNGRIPSR